MGIKVLFLYPNTFGMNMLPPAIALFSAILKHEGHEVALFDATYYAIDYGIDSDGIKAERLNVSPSMWAPVESKCAIPIGGKILIRKSIRLTQTSLPFPLQRTCGIWA